VVAVAAVAAVARVVRRVFRVLVVAGVFRRASRMLVVIRRAVGRVVVVARRTVPRGISGRAIGVVATCTETIRVVAICTVHGNQNIPLGGIAQAVRTNVDSVADRGNHGREASR
jgi:hypothetical protein